MIGRLRNLFAKENGVSLVEAIVSIAIIGFVSAGITALLFFNSRTTKLSEKQSYERDITKIVKENVVASFKSGDPIYGNSTADIVAKNYNASDLEVYDIKGNHYYDYSFDITYAGEPSGAHYTISKYQKFNILIKDADGIEIMNFYIDIY